MIPSSKFIIEYRHIFLSFLLHKKTYIDTHFHHTHTPTCAHSHTTRMHPRIHAHSFTCTHASTHTRSHAPTHPRTLVDIHPRIYTHSFTHTQLKTSSNFSQKHISLVIIFHLCTFGNSF